MIGYYTSGQYEQLAFACLFAKVQPSAYKVYAQHSILPSLEDCEVPIPHIPLNQRAKSLEFNDPMYLHNAPPGNKSVTHRNRLLLDSFEDDGIRLLVVDDSVEVAALARVSSVPYAYVKRLGHRNDLPHHAAYEGAALLLAYYPESLEPPTTPLWVKQKTLYLGFLSDCDRPAQNGERINGTKNRMADVLGKILTVLPYSNGDALVEDDLEVLATRFPEHDLIVLGRNGSRRTLDAIHYYPEFDGDDIPDFLAISTSVAGAATLMNAARCIGFRKYFIPFVRPENFDEDVLLKNALIKMGCAFEIDDLEDGAPAMPDDRNFPDLTASDGSTGKRFLNWVRDNDFDLSKLRDDIRRYGSLNNIPDGRTRAHASNGTSTSFPATGTSRQVINPSLRKS